MTASRLHITGASGAGTTTLGRSLAENLGFRFLDADDFYWTPTIPPYREKRSREDRAALLLDEVRGDLVLSGSIVGWGTDLEDAFDLVVYLWVPTDLRIARLRVRETEEFGEVDEEFIEWAARYDTGGLEVRSRALHERWLSERTCPILRLEGARSVAESLLQVLATLQI